MVRNPVLRGFNPDPSICRVGDDYYIATSTFEWFPGIQIHHSRDLGNWRLLALNVETGLETAVNQEAREETVRDEFRTAELPLPYQWLD